MPPTLLSFKIFFMKVFTIPTIIVLLANGFSTFAQLQIKVIDSITNESIPYVQAAIDSSAIMIADYDGIINIEKKYLISKSGMVKIIFNHLAYESKVVNASKFDKSLTVKLKPKVIMLDSVDIVYKKNSIQNILIVKGFYRTYQLNNEVLKYYSEGLVEYIIPLYKESKYITMNILENETYWNEDLVKEEKQRAFNVKMDIFSPPFLYGSSSTISELDKNFDFVNTENDNIKILDSNLNGAVGSISYDKSFKVVTLNADIDFPNKDKIRKAFGYQFLDKKSTISEIYFPAKTEILKNNYEQLQKKQDYRKVLFKHKSEKNFSTIESFHELYVIDKKYISKEQLSQVNITNYYDVQFSSSDSVNYKNKILELKLLELPSKIKTSLKNNLSKIVPGTECFTCDN